MRTKNTIRDSIAREQEGFTSRLNINQQTKVERSVEPIEEWWQKLAKVSLGTVPFFEGFPSSRDP